MRKAGTVEQDIDRAGVARGAGNVVRAQHVEAGCADAVRRDRLDLRGVDVGRDHARASGGKGERGGAPDALSGGRDEGGLVGKRSSHGVPPIRAFAR